MRVSVKKRDWDLVGKAQKNLEFHIKYLKACERVLKPNGAVWVSSASMLL
jgi:site-specific DNA-methyltransferase (adenine-specific)